jgi:tetratricopeptide (TPR) repeat protein
MKKYFLLFILIVSACVAFAQDDPKTMHETAKTFMRSGDFDNAIIVLTRALKQDRDNLEMQKDLVMSYYLKRDYKTALNTAKTLVDRPDADVVCFQLGGNVYKALEEVKECENVYKKGLKKFPSSGPLLSEYGELLWSTKEYSSAIELWERGIQLDPAYGGNYYNAALHYFYTKDKVWGLIYGEIFVNMESLSQRGLAMKDQLLKAYKEKLFADPDLMKGENKSEFAKAYLQTMSKQSSLANKGINVETLTMIRTRFILDWYANYASKFPLRLFDYQRQLLEEGMFEAYNQWLFGPAEDLAAYDAWSKSNNEKYEAFTKFQKNRVFRMPAGQYYQAN